MNDKKTHMSKKELEKLASRLDKEMKAAAKELEFEEAARLRDLLVIVKGKLGDG